MNSHHHPYLLLFLDVDGKKCAPVVFHVYEVGWRETTLLRLCHSDIFFTSSLRRFPSPQREGRFSCDLIKQNGRHQSPQSHSPKVTAVIYKRSRGQSSTRSLILLIIQWLLFPPLMLKLVRVPRWLQPRHPLEDIFAKKRVLACSGDFFSPVPVTRHDKTYLENPPWGDGESFFCWPLRGDNLVVLKRW